MANVGMECGGEVNAFNDVGHAIRPCARKSIPIIIITSSRTCRVSNDDGRPVLLTAVGA